MKYIEVKFANVPAGMEYMAQNYPGNGCYALANGNLAFVGNGGVMTVMPPYIPQLIESQNAGGGCDANRLLDQVLELRKHA